MVGPQGGGSVPLSAEQLQYLTDQVNAAGAAELPPYKFFAYFTSQTVLDVIVHNEETGRTVGARTKQRNDWERTETSFQKAVADVIAGINW